MDFVVGQVGREPGVYLVPDNWNDWWKWVTQFTAVVVDELGIITTLGSVKIGQKGMAGGDADASPHLPDRFKRLTADFFSLGQTENYYETLAELGDDRRVEYLRSLRDCVFDLSILDDNATEPVMIGSLLRDKSVDRVRKRFNRLAHGNAALTRFSFEYQFPAAEKALDASPVLTFDVRPDVLPPTNVHVLLGRNGVGNPLSDIIAISRIYTHH